METWERRAPSPRDQTPNLPQLLPFGVVQTAMMLGGGGLKRGARGAHAVRFFGRVAVLETQYFVILWALLFFDSIF